MIFSKMFSPPAPSKQHHRVYLSLALGLDCVRKNDVQNMENFSVLEFDRRKIGDFFMVPPIGASGVRIRVRVRFQSWS